MKHALTILLLLLAASVAPLIFPIAESGRSSMDVLAKIALLPAAALLLATLALLYRSNDSLAKTAAAGLAAGGGCHGCPGSHPVARLLAWLYQV